MDRHRFYADPDPTFNTDADLDPILSFKHVRKSDFLILLFTAVPAYIVLSFSSSSKVSYSIFRQYFKIFWKKVKFSIS